MTTRSTPRTLAPVDARVAAIAAGQHGAISRAQALRLGVTESSIKRRVRSGRWLRIRAGVYVMSGTPPSWSRDLWCAVLAVGPSAVVTHESALHLHGLDLAPRKPMTVTLPHGNHAHLSNVVVHQIDDLRPNRIVEISGLRVSSSERVVVELAAAWGPRRLAKVTDEVVRAKKSTYSDISACLQEVARPGKPGVHKLGQVLDERGDGYVPPDSELEAAFFAALHLAGLPSPRRQIPLPGRGALNGLVDAAYPEARLVLEVDGRRWHTRMADMKRDYLRTTEAARVGWQTLRFLYEQIVHDPGEMVASIRDVLTHRAPQLLGNPLQPEAIRAAS